MEEQQEINHQLLPVQPSTERIIFPLNLSKGLYDLSEYAPEMTNHQLSKDDIENLFVKIYERTENFKTVKPGYAAKKIFIFLAIFILLFAASLGAGITVYLRVKNPSENLMLALISLSIFISLVFFIVLITCNVMINSRNKNTRRKIEEVLQEENINADERDLRWKLPKGHYNWIELWNEPKSCPKKTSVL